MKDTHGVAMFEENTLRVVVLGVLCDFLFHISATPIIGGMGFLSFHQLTAAACWCGRCISFFRTLLVEVTTPTLQTTGRLLAVCPNVAEFLAVPALHKTILG
jgi:hypothetical protein